MKRKILLIVSILFINGCGANNTHISTPHKEIEVKKVQIQEDENQNKKISKIYNNLPAWITNPINTKTGITAIGVAQKFKYRTIRDLRRMAFDDALINLAKSISVYISSKLTKTLQYKYKSKNKKDFQKTIELKTQEIVKNVNIVGAREINSYFSESGEFYIRIQIPYNSIDQKIKEEAK